jgi:hypothetical protein
MKPRLVIVMLLILALAVPAVMLAQGSKDEQQIKKNIDELQAAGLKADTAVMEKLLADDYIGIRGDGTVLTKAQEIEAYKSGAIKYAKNEFKDLKIRVYGRSAVSTTLSFSENMRNGKTFSGTTRSARFWVKQDGGWKCVYYQTTRVLD